MSGGPNKIIDDIDDIDGSDYGDDELEDGFDEAEEADISGEEDDDEDQSLLAPEPKKTKAEREPGPASAARRVKAAHDPSKDKTEVRRLASGIHVDAQGNIVDPRDGTIIARAGSERRLFEKNMRADASLGQVQTENKQLKEQIAHQQFLDGIPRKYQLNNEEVQTALAMAAVYKQNPIEAARNMVEMVLALGHNVTDILGKDAGNALEMGAVRQMIDERFQPLTDHAKKAQEAEEQQKNVERQLNEFVTTYEHSDMHLAVLDRMMGDNPDLSPEKAYYELKLFCANKGFDFSKPLKPQLEARVQQARSQQQPARRRGLPNGRQATVSQRDVGDTVQADPHQSWADIIKSSM